MATNNNNAAANLNANATVNANANANANANTNATANPTNNKKESDPEPGFAMFIVIVMVALTLDVPHLAPLTRAIAFMDYGIAAVAAYALLCIFLLCFPLPLIIQLLKHGILFVHLCLSLSASVLVVAMWILTMIVGHNNKAFFIDECLARVANNETASGFWISYQDSFLKQGLVMVDNCNHKWSDPLGGNIAAIIFILIGLGLYMLVAFAYWAHMHVKYTEAKSAAAKKATTRRADAAWNAAAVEL
ncbi:hypothetical protein PUNSTDRAFT_42227 [Punctularia strigosozonata HHB-11173 SS5]|uniref:uncharacterized protein n=1 Tax=Punctularia strigosozonata (strain HHB-11173) TaxID=741275 RepID=UPI0004416CA6|nr:uncharacterized protein PUNSTDRAFT_42227 [Punctularia strigosozonata HHB-11173 SS5]EIN12703.1 hypothetical protein PUNSTDRAFT_42227 [Punctularia strigosozonata HHB-11173 SS5]